MSAPTTPRSERQRPQSPLAMSPDEQVRFLADVHVGVVVHHGDDGGAPLASPVWYAYEPGGDVVFVTSVHSAKARLLGRGDRRATFLVQQEASPQRFVSVTGPVRVEPGATEDVRRTIAIRYLPVEAVAGFVAMTPAEQLVTVSIAPAVWRSSDFGKLATPAGR